MIKPIQKSKLDQVTNWHLFVAFKFTEIQIRLNF